MEQNEVNGPARGRIYNGGKGSPKVYFKYSNDIPDDMRGWFKERENPVTYEVDKAGRKTPRGGRVPTFTGYAAYLGVSRDTLESWRKEHKGFAVAYDICRGIGIDAGWAIVTAVPGSNGVIKMLEVEFGTGLEDGNDDMAPSVFCEVGQNPEELIQMNKAEEEVEEIDNQEEKANETV